MQLVHIPILHSQSDLITNSSSEMFICENNTTEIATVKEIIQVLWKNFLAESLELVGTPAKRYSQEYLGKFKKARLFGEVFAEPEFSKWSFVTFHKLLFGDFYLLYNIKHETGELGCNRKFAKLREKFYSLANKCYESRDFSSENRRKLFFGFFKPAIKAFTIWFYTVCLPANGFPSNDNVFKLEFELTEYDGMCIHVGVESDDPRCVEFGNFVSSCLTYRYEIAAGQLVLKSADDNSIPYDFFSRIEEVFNAERRHLG